MPKVSPKGGIKAKYFSGAISYGAKIQNDALTKIYIDFCALLFLCAVAWLRETFINFTIDI
jgi:hypothetical protein